MKVLVTGAGGFVGKAVVADLAQRSGFEAVAGLRSAPAKGHSGVWLQLGDLGASSAPQLKLEGIDAIVHCAARVHVMNKTAGGALAAYRQVNTIGTMSLAQQAAASSVNRFVFLSSIKVNGERQAAGYPFSAEQLPAPIDAYGVSKLEAENALRELSAQTGMEVAIIRPPLVYGPGVGANFLTMMKWVDKGVPLPLGAATEKRSLVSLANLSDFVHAALVQPQAAGRVLMVSDGQDISVADLLRRIGAALVKPARLLPVPALLIQIGLKSMGKSGYYDRLFGSPQVDISQSRDLLLWTPPRRLEEGIAETVAWYKAQL